MVSSSKPTVGNCWANAVTSFLSCTNAGSASAPAAKESIDEQIKKAKERAESFHKSLQKARANEKEFMENFEAEISLEGREINNSDHSSERMTNKLSTSAMRDSEGEICVGSGEVIGGMVRVQSHSSSGRYSPSIVAQEDNHDFDEGNVDDFLDEMEELVDER